MITLRTDSAGLSSNVRRVRANRAPARTMAVRVQADLVVANVEQSGPRDTNRFVRAVIQAGNDAGVRQRALPPLKESRNRHYAIVNLEQAVGLSKANVEMSLARVHKWEKYEKLYRSQGRTHYKFFTKIKAEKRNANKELRFHTRRLESALTNQARLLSEEGRYAVTMGGFGRGAVHVRPDGTVKVRTDLMQTQKRSFRYRDGTVILKRNIQVAVKDYGGYGVLLQSATHSIVRLVNTEPHARIVERNTRIMKRSVDQARHLAGARWQSRKTYNEQIALGTTWSGGRFSTGALPS